MKKSVVLAMALALGITGSAYAANPFSDVPAGHWAYASISRLVNAGVIEGYPDGSFGGDKLMTRYEMAQIVAKAMARGANIDRLAAEFADELDALGVRVANLEKKSDNVRINGQFRGDYATTKTSGKSSKDKHSTLRSRIWFTGDVNDDWQYVGMLQNEQDLLNNKGDEETKFQRAYLQGRVGGLKTVAGRFQHSLVDSEVYGTRFDGVKVGYGKDVKFGAYFGKPTDQKSYEGDATGVKYNKAWGVNADTKLGHSTGLTAGYDRFYEGKDGAGNSVHENGIVNAGLNFDLGNDFDLSGSYLHSTIDEEAIADGASRNGWFAKLNYAGAKNKEVGSFGIGATYYHMGAGNVVANVWDSQNAYKDLWNEGFRGWKAQANYTVAKNMIMGVQYWDLKGRETDTEKKTIWTDLTVAF